jgi:hypothetical protein
VRALALLQRWGLLERDHQVLGCVRALIPFIKALPLPPNHFPKALLLNTTLGINSGGRGQTSERTLKHSQLIEKFQEDKKDLCAYVPLNSTHNEGSQFY